MENFITLEMKSSSITHNVRYKMHDAWCTIRTSLPEHQPNSNLSFVILCWDFTGTRRYRPLRGLYFWLLGRASASGRGFFFPSGKKDLFMLFWLTLGPFWCSVVNSVTFSSILSNFEKNPKNPKNSKKSQKNTKNQRNQKNLKKIF